MTRKVCQNCGKEVNPGQNYCSNKCYYELNGNDEEEENDDD